MKVITDDKIIAIEILSAQDLFNEDIEEIKIIGWADHRYGINNYNAKVTIKNMEFMLYRDLNFKNIDIKQILKKDIPNIKYEIINKWSKN